MHIFTGIDSQCRAMYVFVCTFYVMSMCLCLCVSVSVLVSVCPRAVLCCPPCSRVHIWCQLAVALQVLRKQDEMEELVRDSDYKPRPTQRDKDKMDGKQEMKPEIKQELKQELGADYKPHNIAEKEASGGYTRRSKRARKEVRMCFISARHTVLYRDCSRWPTMVGWWGRVICWQYHMVNTKSYSGMCLLRPGKSD